MTFKKNHHTTGMRREERYLMPLLYAVWILFAVALALSTTEYYELAVFPFIILCILAVVIKLTLNTRGRKK